MAICRIENGVAQTECISPPHSVTLAARFAAVDTSLSALVAGQRASNWTLSNLYREKRLALAPLGWRDIEALEAGIEGIPIERVAAGMRLAPETIASVTKVVRSVRRQEGVWFEGGWSAVPRESMQAAEMHSDYYLSGKHSELWWPVYYDPHFRQEEHSSSRDVSFVVQKDDSGDWYWELVSAEGYSLAIGQERFKTREECTNEIHRLLRPVINANVIHASDSQSFPHRAG
jgi:hypothetical protein